MEIIADYIDLVMMCIPEIEISGIVIITLSIVIVVVLALRYEKRRKKNERADKATQDVYSQT